MTIPRPTLIINLSSKHNTLTTFIKQDKIFNNKHKIHYVQISYDTLLVHTRFLYLEYWWFHFVEDESAQNFVLNLRNMECSKVS